MFWNNFILMELNFSLKFGKSEQQKSGGNSFFQLVDSNASRKSKINIENATPRSNFKTLELFYNNVPELYSIINYIAQKGSEIPYKIVKYNYRGEGTIIENTDISEAIDRPFNTTKEEFIKTIITNYVLYGNCYLFKESLSGFKIPQLKLLPTKDTYVISRDSFDDYGNLKQNSDIRYNQITGYNYFKGSAFVKMKADDVIHIRTSNVNTDNGEHFYGFSGTYTAVRSIKSLSNVYDVINCILESPLGFLKKTTKKYETSMDPEEKNKIEEKINKVYSKIGGRRNKFATDVDLEYQSMVEALSAFMPIELKASEFDTLCNVLGGMPSVLLNAKDASTYNNIKELSKIFYINTLIPILTDVYSSISRGLGINKESIWIEPDTSKIEALLPDVIKQIETKKTETEYYVYLFEKGLMTEGELKNKIKL